jgi:hypothetical protein
VGSVLEVQPASKTAKNIATGVPTTDGRWLVFARYTPKRPSPLFPDLNHLQSSIPPVAKDRLEESEKVDQFFKEAIPRGAPEGYWVDVVFSPAKLWNRKDNIDEVVIRSDVSWIEARRATPSLHRCQGRV